MSLKVEKLEGGMAKLTIEVSAEEFKKAIETAYNKNKKKISLPGFRAGKVPRNMIEKMYGKGVFYEDAANELIPGAYEKAFNECEEEIVSTPEIDVVQAEEGKPFIFTAEVALKPEVTLGKYKDVEIDKIEVEVSEEEINAEIEKERKNSARTITVEDRPVQDADIVTIDFEGFVDDVAFDGGKGEDFDLTIGSHSFIDTFEEQLIGKNIGDDVEVNVTFPENYHAEDLKGKPALFKVKIKGIKENELPELDDDFASEVSEYDTFEEYKKSVEDHLREKKTGEAKTKKEDAVIAAIIEDAKMDIPEAMLKTEQRTIVNDFSQRLQMQGMNIEQYYMYTGTNEEKMMEDVKAQAERRIKTRLVCEAIVDAEKIEVSEEELDAEIKKLADQYGLEFDKVKNDFLDEERIKEFKKDIAIQKAITFVSENAKEK
ncbi:MAG: trigger factor [Lachnospiraceae bacterium]|nr:trigger factor [Lachnospiraceae bacterium]